MFAFSSMQASSSASLPDSEPMPGLVQDDRWDACIWHIPDSPDDPPSHPKPRKRGGRQKGCKNLKSRLILEASAIGREDTRRDIVPNDLVARLI